MFHEGTLGARFHSATNESRHRAFARSRHDGSFALFSDPDGNGWLIQEVTTCLPGRVDAGHHVLRLGERPGQRASAGVGRPR